LFYYNDDYQRSNRSSNSCCNRQSLARMGWWCYCRWVCPNITRTFFFFFFLLPLTSSSSLVFLTVTARPSICLSTTLLLRVQALLQGKKNTLQGKPTGFKLPFPTCSKLLVQIYESSLYFFVPPLHHQEHQMQ